MNKRSCLIAFFLALAPLFISAEGFMHVGIAQNKDKADPNSGTEILWLAPSVSLDFWIKELSTGQQTYGVAPGVGYGIRWNPMFYQKTGKSIGSQSLLALDLYVSATSSGANDYFNISVLPSITLIDWVGIGLGWRYKSAMPGSGLSDSDTWIISICIKKTIN